MAHVSQQRALPSGASSHPSISHLGGELRAQWHGWISLSLCETIHGRLSLRHERRQQQQEASCHLGSQPRRAETRVPYAHSCGARGRRCHPSARHAACQPLALGSGRAGITLRCLALPPPPPPHLAWSGTLQLAHGGPDPDLGFTSCTSPRRGVSSPVPPKQGGEGDEVPGGAGCRRIPHPDPGPGKGMGPAARSRCAPRSSAGTYQFQSLRKRFPAG